MNRSMRPKGYRYAYDLIWDSKAWQDYVYWQGQDRKREKRSEAVLGVSCGQALTPMSHRFKKPLRGK